MPHRRHILYILAGVAATAIAVAAGLALFFPTERVAALAERRAEAVLGREVRIGSVELDLLPAPAVELTNVRIGGPDSATAGQTAHPERRSRATVRRVRLEPRLLPLLVGRVIIDHVAFERPRVWLDVREAPGPPEQPTGAGVGTDGVAFLVQDITVEDGRLGYRNHTTGTLVRLSGIDQRVHLSGELRDGALARIRAEGTLEIARLDARLPQTLPVPLRDVEVEIEYVATLDRARERLTIGRLMVRLERLALEGTGVVRHISSPDERRVALRFSSGSFDTARLLPAVHGRARLEVRVRGPLSADTLPMVHGTLALRDVSVESDDGGRVVRGLGGTVGFSLDSLASAGLTGRLGGEPLRLAFHIRRPARPTGRVELRVGESQLALEFALRERTATLGDDSAPRRLALEYRLRNGRAERFFRLLVPLEHRITGSLSLAGTALLPLDERFGLIRDEVTAEGTLALENGWLAGWPMLETLARRLGLPRLDTLAFRRWNTRFELAGERVELEESVFDAENLEARIAGTFDMSGRLNLAATLYLAPPLAARAVGLELPGFARALIEDNERVPVDVRVTGTAEDPRVNIDVDVTAGLGIFD